MVSKETIIEVRSGTDQNGNPYVPEDATSEDEIRSALKGESSQMDGALDNFVAGMTTEEDIISAIDQSGTVPDRDEIENVTASFDDISEAGVEDRVSESIEDQVVTETDINMALGQLEALPETPDIDAAVRSAGSGKQFVGASESDVMASAREQVATRSDVINELGSNLPDRDGIETAVSNVSEDKSMIGRADVAADQLESEIVTREEVEDTIPSVQSDSRLTTTQDIESAVDEVASSRELTADKSSAVDDIGDDVGAVDRAEFSSALGETLTSGGEVNPSERDDVESGRDESVSVIEDQAGETVGVLSFGGNPAAESVAESLDAEIIEGRDDFEIEQDSSGVSIKAGGRTVRRVDR